MANTHFILVDDTQTGQQALDQAQGADYIIIYFSDGRYAVVKPVDLGRKLKMWNSLQVPLKDVPANALAPHLTPAISENDPHINTRIQALKTNEPLVVVSSAGDFVALAVGGATFRGGTPKMGEMFTKGPVTLTADENAAEAAKSAQPQPRHINVEVRDRSGQLYPAKEKPLQLEQTYRLLFDIDVKVREEALAASKFQDEKAFSSGENEIELIVQLSSDDFKIRPEQQILYVPRYGRSDNAAEFNIVPLRNGPGVINAVFLKENNFIQVMTLKFFVGELFTQETLGRDINAASVLTSRDVSLTILNTGASFQLILVSPGVAATATLPLKLDELKDIVNQGRDKLLALVNYQEDGHTFYQDSLDIPPEINEFALQQLAETGFRMYQRIFFGPAADEQSKNLGRKLRELAQKEKLKIQIFSQEFVLPWGLLYMADRFDPDTVKPELFLGLKHIIEHIPLQQSLKVTDNRLDGSQGLAVSLNVNTDIDADMKQPFVGSQLDYWKVLEDSGAKISVVTRKTEAEVIRALANPQTPDQVLYFYCHGISKDVDEKGGVSKSMLILSNKGKITVDDLYAKATTDDQLPNAPLVFINACESAQLSPLVYDGFVPYFMSKGARGVIGTEVETPALFAVEWAKRFFDRFLQGEPLGETFLALRKEFYEQNHNLMGLLYALYVDGDTKVEPAVKKMIA